MIPRSLWQAAFWGYLAIITWLSLAPIDQLPQFNIWDKASHGIAFFALGFTLHLAYQRCSLPALFALLMAYGLATETAQGLLPFRQFSLLDLVADAIGAIPGLLAAARMRQLLTTSAD